MTFRAMALALSLVSSSCFATYQTAVVGRENTLKLEAMGASLSHLLGLSDEGKVPPLSTDRLAHARAYEEMVRVVAGDLARDQGKEGKVRPPATGPGRFFHASWLRSPLTWFELVGGINRLDRAAFEPGTCGELRLIYRLAYRARLGKKDWESRLPMTLNLVFLVPRLREGCRAWARRWESSSEADLLRPGGPLQDVLERKLRPARLEINLQSARWDPGYRPDLAGHSDYLLRVFRWNAAGRLVPTPLENSPDVDRLLREGSQKKELLAWILRPDTLKAVDEGIARMPETFAAQRMISAAPLGLGRLANRPFRRLFSPGDFSKADLSPYRTISTPEALLRRLDTLSCAGCHESRSIAGFHFLGEDKATDRGVNALLNPGSRHFTVERKWRESYGLAVAGGRDPDPYRLHPELGEPGEGAYGARCGRGDGGVSQWRCGPGLVCKAAMGARESEAVGECLPGDPQIGDPCVGGTLDSEGDPHRDRVVEFKRLPCPKGEGCSPREIGFPEGMCVADCSHLPTQGACQPVPRLQHFTECLSRGNTFRECFVTDAGPTGLRACSVTLACRDDFLCAATSVSAGVCVPPYFLFQLVITGHPLR